MGFRFNVEEPSTEGLIEVIQPFSTVQNNGTDVKYAKRLEYWKANMSSPAIYLRGRAANLKAVSDKLTAMMDKIPGPSSDGWIQYDRRVTAAPVVSAKIYAQVLGALDRILSATIASGGGTGTASKVLQTAKEVQSLVPCSAATSGCKLAWPEMSVTWPNDQWYVNKRGCINSIQSILNPMVGKLDAAALKIGRLLQMPTTGTAAGVLCDRVAYIQSACLISKLMTDTVSSIRRTINSLVKITVGKK